MREADSAPRVALGGCGVRVLAERFTVFATIGRGGMAEVYLGATSGPGGWHKLVVIKELRASHATEPEMVSMFLDEARLAARLQHPNVVCTYEVCETSGGYFMVMEYLDGQPVNALVSALRARGQALPPAVAVRLVAGALRGLHHAHELRDYDGTPLGVIHRDISPHNIFVTYDGAVKLLDFGIAKATNNSTHTQAGVLKGKFSYMAPEQLLSEGVDRRADIFSMGVVLWELLVGRKLFAGGAAAALNKVLSQDIPAPSTLVPDVPPELDRIVARALSRPLDGRYRTAEEMRQELDMFLRDREVPDSDTALPELLHDLFASAREEQRKKIETYLAGTSLRLAASSSGMRLRLPSHSGETSSYAKEVPPVTAPSQLVQTYAAAQRPRATRTLLFAATGLLAVAAAVFTARQEHGRRRVSPHPLSAAFVQEGDNTEGQQYERAARTDARHTQLTITAQPESAALYLDDTHLGSSPFSGRFPEDGSEHVLRVTARGYDTYSVRLRFDQARIEHTVALRTATPAPSTHVSRAGAGNASTVVRKERAPSRAAVAGRTELPASAPPDHPPQTFNPWQ